MLAGIVVLPRMQSNHYINYFASDMVEEKRLSSVGRQPSDVDGDTPRRNCAACGRSDFEDNMTFVVDEFGESWICYGCSN